MKLLLIEDSDDKRAKIAEEVSTHFPGAELSFARSFDSGLRAVARDRARIDGILLDMSMPNFDKSDEPPESYTGRDLLRQLKLRKLTLPTIVITQLDSFGKGANQLSLPELRTELEVEFANCFLGLIYFSSAQETWKRELFVLLNKLRDGK